VLGPENIPGGHFGGITWPVFRRIKKYTIKRNLTITWTTFAGSNRQVWKNGLKKRKVSGKKY